MALEQKLSLKLSQRLVMTPSLQQAIKLLQMTRMELETTVAQEIEANPVLEEIEEAAEEEVADAGHDQHGDRDPPDPPEPLADLLKEPCPEVRGLHAPEDRRPDRGTSTRRASTAVEARPYPGRRGHHHAR